MSGLSRKNQKGCIYTGVDLLREHDNQGKLYFVEYIENEKVMHAVFVPDGANDLEIALNQQDKGWPTNMTIATAKEYGRDITKEYIK
jgi:hypothetical protein